MYILNAYISQCLVQKVGQLYVSEAAKCSTQNLLITSPQPSLLYRTTGSGLEGFFPSYTCFALLIKLCPIHYMYQEFIPVDGCELHCKNSPQFA